MVASSGVNNLNEPRNVILLIIVAHTIGGGMATIVIPLNQHHAEKGIYIPLATGVGTCVFLTVKIFLQVFMSSEVK